jgi:hypothetical protein
MSCRKVLALIVVWLFAGCVHDAAPVASAPARELAPEKPAFLWKIDKDGKSSWLFGTIHVGVDARKELPAGVWAAMNGAPCFVMETDPGTVSSTELFAMSRLPRGKTLDRPCRARRPGSRRCSTFRRWRRAERRWTLAS